MCARARSGGIEFPHNSTRAKSHSIPKLRWTVMLRSEICISGREQCVVQTRGFMPSLAKKLPMSDEQILDL